MARSCKSDPLEKFRFQVSWSSVSVGSEGTELVRVGFHDIQMPKRTTNKIAYREGIDPDISQQAPGLSTMEDVVMSRGIISLDPNGEFYSWASAIHLPSAGHIGRDSLKSRPAKSGSNTFRKDIVIDMLDREGSSVRRWILHQAWPVNFVPGSDLNAAEDGEKSMEQLTLAYEDFTEVQLFSTGK